MAEFDYDVVIIGTGLAGAILAKQLGKNNRKVLLLEAGVQIPHGREALVERFYLDTTKFPEAPYPDNPFAPRAAVEHLIGNWNDPSRTYLDQSESRIPFGSTYERRAGGTMWHWMGTTLRFLPEDFRLKSEFGHGVDWPITYDDLAVVPRDDGRSYYDMAEDEIGVSANVEDQDPGRNARLFRAGREYPNPGIPLSRVDQFFTGVGDLTFEGQPVRVIPTPAGRNSRPYQNRRVCAGNTNCVPICPIEAKYDATVTLHAAFNFKSVQAHFQCVATKLLLDPTKRKILGVQYVRYESSPERVAGPPETAIGKYYVVAANAIESPKLLLMSGLGRQNPNIGRNLMDHPFFLRWGLAPRKIYPYRGPLSTGGLDSLRTGPFRKQHAAFRIEIGNDGWALPAQDPARTLLDHIEGTNSQPGMYGKPLVERLNNIYTRQCRIGFELEQLPDPSNRVELSPLRDALGLQRPKVHYSISDYEAAALARASGLADRIFAQLEVDDKTSQNNSPSFGRWEGKNYEFMGAGHMLGTCCMGRDPRTSVVNERQQSHEYDNLYVVGGSVFPTGATANPSLTIAALAFWAADTIHNGLAGS